VTTRSLTLGSYGLPAGTWRWAALSFVLLALVAAAVAIGAPDASRWVGVALLAGIGAVASLFLYAVWPRESMSVGEARMIAEAAARANVAWVVTASDGAVLECNDAYRILAGVSANESPPPPELALASDAAAATLYRLARSAGDGEPREEIFSVGAGIEIAAAVRPLSGGSVAWWFSPRLATQKESAAAKPVAGSGAVSAAFFRDAPFGVAVVDGDGRIVEANNAFAEFFGVAQGRIFSDLVESSDRASLNVLLVQSLSGAHSSAIELQPVGQTARMAELHASPASGDPKRSILYLIDVTEQKELETKFAQ